MDVLVKFGDSRSNRSRDVRLPHFVKNDNTGIRRSSRKRYGTTSVLSSYVLVILLSLSVSRPKPIQPLFHLSFLSRVPA